MLYTQVPAKAAAGPTVANLLASALEPATTDDRWQEGLSVRGETCPALQVFGPCSEPSAPDLDSSTAWYVRPAGYRVTDECTTLDRGFDETRVTRMAEAVASYAVANELWTGAGTLQDPFDVPAPDGATHNPYLADSNAVVIPNSGDTAVASELDALGVLEQVARQQTKGQQVMLHVPIRLITRVGQNLVRAGNEIRTLTGAIVIADAGYPGTGPSDGGTQAKQTVTVTGAPTGGSFTLTRLGQTTAAIPWNATAVQVSNALAALSLTGPGAVTVSGTGPYVVTTVTPGPAATLTASGAGLTGGTAPAVTVTSTTTGVAPAPQAGLWAFATGLVEARLGQLVTTDDPAITTDRSTNRRQVWADRMFAASFDPCCQFAIKIPVP